MVGEAEPHPLRPGHLLEVVDLAALVEGLPSRLVAAAVAVLLEERDRVAVEGEGDRLLLLLVDVAVLEELCLLYTSPSPRD